MLVRFKSFMLRRLSEQRGAALVEYVILVALIALVAIAAITRTGTSLTSVFNKITSALGRL